MITKEQAMTVRKFFHVTERNADGTAVRCRANGVCKTWKTRPADFRLPVKHGLKLCFYITPENADKWMVNDPTEKPSAPAAESYTLDEDGDEVLEPTPIVDVEGEQRADPTRFLRGMETTARIATSAAAAAGPTAPAPATTVSAAPPASPSTTTPSTTTHSGLAAGLRGSPDDDAPHVEVQALAGTGKTTSAIEGIKEAKGIKSALTPSPQQQAIWDALKAGKSESVRISSFSTKITDELKSRVDACGLDRRGVEARGIHSLGNAAVRQRFGRVSADKAKWVVMDTCLDLIGKGGARLKELSVAERDLLFAADELVSLCKQTLAGEQHAGHIAIPSDELDQLCSRYDVSLSGQRERTYDLVHRALERCLTPRDDRDITFDDMIWLPLVHDLPIPKVDLQIVDEAQDLNRMQQELIYRAGRRIMFVGDVHQAIYGFAGADAESMKRMRATLNAAQSPPNVMPVRPRGCVTLPLTVTRRCGKEIVKAAQRWVPEYEAHESNPTGSVTDARMSQYRARVQAGDFILCRANAPLISQCLRFVKEGRKAVILGKKDVSAGLIALVEKSKAHRTPDLIAWMGDWLAKEQANERAKRWPSEGRLENLQDKHDCLLAFTEGMSEVEDVKRKIASVFADAKDAKGITLSSIHKSKGLESRRVFILPSNGPRTDKMQAWELEQENNLRYVAITRAIEELCYVTAEK